VEPGITVEMDETLPSKVIPKSAVTWSDNRLDDIYTILEAWPARARITTDGYLAISPVLNNPIAADVVFDFSDGEAVVEPVRPSDFYEDIYADSYGTSNTGVTRIIGTVTQYTANITRDGAYNSVIAIGQYDDDRGTLAGLPIVHTALDVDPDSPYSLLGNFSPYLVPYKYDSPLLNEHTETLLAANTKLRELRLKASRTVRINCVPNPALQLGDAVRVTSDRLGLSDELGRIDAFTLPYGADGGEMQVTVRLAGLI